MNLQEALDRVLEKPISWLESLVTMLPNLLVAVIVVVAFWLLAKAVRKGLLSLLKKVQDNKQLASLAATAGYIATLAAGVMVALSVLNLEKAVTSLLAGVGIVGLALGFAFQDLAANFMAGILIAIRRPFKQGDVIESNDFMGVVESVNLRTTIVRTFQGQILYLPNKDVFGNPLLNYSESGSRRVDLAVGVSYGDDLQTAREIAVAAAEGVSSRDPDRDVELFYEEFGGSSINFTLRLWIQFEKQTDFLAARSEAIERVKSAFDEKGITIPFPIRTLDFGIVGGQNVAEALPSLAGSSDGEKSAD